tara:strand:- start:976 stop:1653 length:678 start_codon:yes stop_codon:yes gene_type:complete
MAKEFKIKKGLLVEGSGSTGDNNLVDVQGNLGQLFSVTDSLSGSLFSVNDISGFPLLEVDSSGTVIGGISTTTPSAIIQEGVSSVYGDMSDWGSLYVSGEIMKNQTMNSTVAFGECLSLADGLAWDKADQGEVVNAQRMLGISLGAGTTVDVLIKGFVETDQVEDSAAENGLPMYLRESTAGDLSNNLPSSGVVRLVGYVYQNSSTSTNGIFVLRFDPDNTWVEL